MTRRDVIVIGAGHNGLDCRDAAGQARAEDARPRADRSRRWMRALGRGRAGISSARRWRTRRRSIPTSCGGSGWCGTGCESSGPSCDACAPTLDGRALVLWHDAARAAAADPRVLGQGRRAVPALPEQRRADQRRAARDRRVGAAIHRQSWRRRPDRAAARPDGSSARWASPTPTGCCAGCRWPPPTSSANGSRASRCAPRSRPAACSGRSSGRGRPAARRSCSCSARAKGTRSRAAGSSSGEPARCPTRCRPRRGRPAWRFGPASASRGSMPPTAPPPASRCRPASRSPRAPSSRTSTRSARCSACSIRCTSSRSSSGGCRTSAPTGRWRRSTTPSRRCRGSPASRRLGASEQAAALSGRIRLARNIDGIERAFDAAKYGTFAHEPWIELTIPSIADPGLTTQGGHVVSAYVQYAPYHLRGTNWDAERESLGDRRDRARSRATRPASTPPSSRARSSRRSTSNARTGSPAATSSTASWRSISGS